MDVTDLVLSQVTVRMKSLMTRCKVRLDRPSEGVPGHAEQGRRRAKKGLRLLGPAPLYFLLIGLLLFCTYKWLVAWSGFKNTRTIEITAEQIDRARSDWMVLHKAIPTSEEEQALIDRLIDEEILFREALRIGLDRSSPVVRRRLRQIANFADLDPKASEETLLVEARALGLDRDDPIIRRHLIGMMSSLYQRGELQEGPTEAEVRAYVEQQPGRFMVPRRISFVHVYLSADRRGAGLSQDASRLLERLRKESVSPEQAAKQGDVFLRGYAFRLQTHGQVTRVFGPGFAEAVMAMDPGSWFGPIKSAYGLHLVWVQDKVGERLPEFTLIRGRAYQELVQLRGKERMRERLDAIRGNYEIRIEEETGLGEGNVS